MQINGKPNGLTADWLIDMIQSRGMRITVSRRAMCDWLAGQTQGFTSSDLVEAMESHAVGKATVYRNLSFLEAHGLVRSLVAPDGSRLYHLSGPEHSHQLICNKCGVVERFSNCGWQEVAQELEEATGFEVTGHFLEVRGLCSDCRA